ncbi:MAG TPA: PilZ domain-containing protein [Croceibacterium sp.]|nr:PilZ domain-containing protein [Croceibacterium sp.]
MDKRAAFRFPTDLEADCRSGGHAWKSRMRNVSTGGCMIECPEAELAKGGPLRLRLKGLPAIDGEVAWQHRGHAGVKFRAALEPALLEELAFRTPDGLLAAPLPLSPQPASAPPRGAPPALHGQLVKRSWPGPDGGLDGLAKAS